MPDADILYFMTSCACIKLNFVMKCSQYAEITLTHICFLQIYDLIIECNSHRHRFLRLVKFKGVFHSFLDF